MELFTGDFFVSVFFLQVTECVYVHVPEGDKFMLDRGPAGVCLGDTLLIFFVHHLLAHGRLPISLWGIKAASEKAQIPWTWTFSEKDCGCNDNELPTTFDLQSLYTCKHSTHRPRSIILTNAPLLLWLNDFLLTFTEMILSLNFLNIQIHLFCTHSTAIAG